MPIIPPGTSGVYVPSQPGFSPLDEKRWDPSNGGAPPAPGEVGLGNAGAGQTVPDAQGNPGASGRTTGSTPGNGAPNAAAGFGSAKFVGLSNTQSQGGPDEARLQKVLAQIRDVSSSGIDLLARVMLEQQGMQRHEAVQERTQLRALARESLMQAAGELNKQASAMETAAIVQLVVACVSAAVTIGMAGLSAGLKTGGAMNEAKGFADTGVKLTSKLSTVGEGVSGAAQGFSKMGEAMGNFAGTQGQIAVKQSEAAQKVDEANAQQYEAQADLKKGMQDAFDDGLKQIIEFVKQMKDAVADLQSSITRHC